MIEATPEQLDRFVTSLGEEYYANRESAQEALVRRSMFNTIHLDTGWKADLIVREDRPFSVGEFSRRQIGTLYGRELPIASAKDVILTKLEWNRITPSERQLRDASNVAAVRWSVLDREYLSRWAAVLGVSDTLAFVLLEAQQRQSPVS